MSTPLWIGARRLVDDAAVFPPGSLPLPEAVVAHVEYRRDVLTAQFVGPLVLRATDIGQAVTCTPTDTGPIDVSAIVIGAGGVADVLDAWAADPRVQIAALEVTASCSTSAEAVLELEAIARVVAHEKGASRLDPEVLIFVEVGWPALESDGATVVAATARRLGLALKLRTGGVVAEAFPTESQLSRAIFAIVSLGAPFKCTAGLHHAVRHRDAATGFEHHGFLNVLAATCAAAGGEDLQAVTAVVAEQDATKLTELLVGASTEDVRVARSLFRSYGSCSITEPLDEMARLGLLTRWEAA